jgi:predicted acylesterase/phospholipase RssA
MIRQRKNNDNIIYTTNNTNDKRDDKRDDKNVNNTINNIDYFNIETLIFSSTEMYILSILGHIDKLIINNKINMDNIKNYVSSSLGTIVILYLSFKYKPKEILQIFYDNLLFISDNIFNIADTFGIFEIKNFVNKLLEPLYNKLGYIPTLKDIYNLTNIHCIFIGYNFTRNKVILYNYKKYPETKIDEVIQKCCIIPILFKKYLNNETKIDLEDLYIDYSLIDNREYDYSINIFNKSKVLLLKTNIIYENDTVDINNINIFEYVKNIFETVQNREKEQENKLFSPNVIDINIKKYNKTLLFDEHVKYKEYVNLYCYGFNYNINYISNENNNIYNDEIDNKINEMSIDKISKYTGIVIGGGGTNAYNLLGCIIYCIDNKIIDMNTIDTFIGTSAGSFFCTILALNFKKEEVIDVYLNCFLNKLDINISNIDIIERLNKKSIYPNKILIESYEMIFIKYRDGNIPTLLDIKNNYGKNLIYTVFNVTKNKLEYLNYENAPELLVTQACAMSSCIPFVFNPIEFNKCYYLDGGIKSNYSVEVTNNYSNKRFIGFGLTFLSNYTKMNILEYIFYITSENSRKHQVTKIKNAINCDSYCMNIVYDDDRDSNSLLAVTQNTINKFIDKGYKYMENKIKK